MYLNIVKCVTLIKLAKIFHIIKHKMDVKVESLTVVLSQGPGAH